MTLYISQTLLDGSVVVADADDPNVSYVLKPGQADELLALPEDRQRERLRELLVANRADPTGGRTVLDEQAIETAQNASSGEAHQEGERQ